MNNNTSNCVFLTKEPWFNSLYDSDITIVSELQTINLNEYKKLLEKIKDLTEKQSQNPINSRNLLIHLKELQKIIFENQFNNDYSMNMFLKKIRENPDINFRRNKRIQDPIIKRKIGLLSAIYEMERSLCSLELTRDISHNRNIQNVQLRNNENPEMIPKLFPKRRKLMRNWVNAINQPNITINKINNLSANIHNENSKKEFARIFQILKKNNYNTFIRFKKKDLKTEKCQFAIEELTPEEKNNFINELQQKPIIQWNTILNMIGLNSLPFLMNNRYSKNKRALTELLNLYLMPLMEPFDDIFRLKREYYSMCITYVLLDFNMESMNYLPMSEGPSGFTATTRINDTSIYKLENLRLSNYPKSSYMSSFYLFAFFIQKYLYSLNQDYVPNIENIYLHFTEPNTQKRLSITKMNLAKRNLSRTNIINYEYSTNLHEILIKPIKKNEERYFFEVNNFEVFVIEVLKKVCVILNFYQRECFFIHRDLHTSNIMINFNIIDNNFDINNFEVKLIDFIYSSIVIPNKGGEQSELMGTNFNLFNDIFLSNPYLNKNWNTHDLRYFIQSLLFTRLYDGDMNKLKNNILINESFNNNKIRPLKNLRNKILKIFHIQKNYLQSFLLYKSNILKKERKVCIPYDDITHMELLLDNNVFHSIMGKDCRIEYFEPLYFLHKLNEVNQL